MFSTWIQNAMKNWKPLAGGLVAAAPDIINFITPLIAPEYAGLVRGIGLAFAAIFIKQKNVTGGDVKQKM